MKKISLLFMSLFLFIMIAACGAEQDDTEDQGANGEDQEQQDDQENGDDAGPDDEGAEEGEELAEEAEEAQPGDTIENEAGTFTLHRKTEEAHTFETGPITLTIEQVATASGELQGDMAEFMETDQLEYVQVDIHVENTSDDDITFYSSQGTMATSTGEQLDPDMWLSDHIEGDMMANTQSSGTFFYVLENSSAEDVENVRLVFSAPHDEDWEDVGEKVDMEIDLY
ncbi:DUF4352 domain-containing protein [Alkalibacillus aidingensis]|uniref:DUF4352 domain-containing protein n=1 Tax=Alkalibacillus aidingensis TaxID=2747607 RepID=UPI0016609653|nr:DUF4352 domain-containing protein [Alkalibacillus aidingensis]